MKEELCESNDVVLNKAVPTSKIEKESRKNLENLDAQIEVAHIYFIEERRLWRECLSHGIEQFHPDVRLTGYDSIERYLDSNPSRQPPGAVVIYLNENKLSEASTGMALRKLVKDAEPTPVVVLSDSEDITLVLSILDCGVSGYIPTTIGLEVIVEAMKAAAFGGVMLTSQGFGELRQLAGRKLPAPEVFHDTLTSRQSAVAEALRHGKPNKIIAHELDMCENTVKVHVRNILKKLDVTNRTEAAYKLNEKYADR